LKASEQRQNNNNNALENYALVALINGQQDTYDNIQTNIMAAYPQQYQQREYLKASEQEQGQRQNSNNNNISLALANYALVRNISSVYG
jgi:hypothetical protein